jgi:8-oxo-dGTP pyrophosphatase MutT (NUDIX family)
MPSTPRDLRNAIEEVLLAPAEAIQLSAHGGVVAAVLVPLRVDERGLSALFTKRAAELRRHAGEISFPGGRQDSGEELLDTALREAEEEIGLRRELVEVVGALPPTSTIVTNYVIYPFVGMLAPGGRLRPNPIEVEAVVELGLRELFAGFGRRRLIRRGVPIKTDTYLVDEHLIWGATARILGELLGRLRPIL